MASSFVKVGIKALSKGARKGVTKGVTKGTRKATTKAAWETGEQFFKRMDKDGLVPEVLSDITRSDMIEQINIQKGSNNKGIEDTFRGYAEGNTDAHQDISDYTTTLSGASHYQQNYNALETQYRKGVEPETANVTPQDTSGVPTSESIINEFPVQPRNVDTDLPSYISEKDAKLRNRKMREAGITEYTDEHGHKWKEEGIKSKQWRNTVTRGATKKAMNPFTGEIGTRLASTIRYVNKRLRGIVASSAEEAKNVGDIVKTKARINNESGLPKDHPNYMTIEHRIADSDWKRLGLEGNPADSPNLWLTTRYEAQTKTSIENSLRNRKGEYIVDFNPETTALHVMRLEDFKLHGEPTGKAFEKVDGKYDWDAINEYLKTLE